ncbi:HIRAN domain-containing protein [Pseudophaeobacter flagellatus]|uniref:HIRAN domain-containing protein n=1 Tax=Pseudophaeobacter flagellatus TaxID=2899119 RepID=UPI001E4861B2|nr:HIRAN domain-containing protein [Pseudophaeobacter flagellatus]MCD9149009.1 HIRAN domain-containing protein [Pseudophaeobacter flagellatus]
MFIIWLVLAALGMFALAGILGRWEKRITKDNPRHKDHTAECEFDGDNDYEDEDDLLNEEGDYQSKWEITHFPSIVSKRPKGFVALKGYGNINLAGLSAEKTLTNDFIRIANPSKAFASLQREPDNPHDPNAIRVFGHTAAGAPALPIGYIPATVAAELNHQHPEDMPIGIEIKKIGKLRTGESCFINVLLTGPNAAMRKKLERVG